MGKTNRRNEDDKFNKKSKKQQAKKNKGRKSSYKQQLRHIQSANDWSEDYEDLGE